MLMDLKTYQAYSMGEVLTRIRHDLGQDAVVLHTRTFKRGGMLGLGARTVYEVTATCSQHKPEDRLKVAAKLAGQVSPDSTAFASTANREYGTPSTQTLLKKAVQLESEIVSPSSGSHNRQSHINSILHGSGSSSQAGSTAQSNGTPIEHTPNGSANGKTRRPHQSRISKTLPHQPSSPVLAGDDLISSLVDAAGATRNNVVSTQSDGAPHSPPNLSTSSSEQNVARRFVIDPSSNRAQSTKTQKIDIAASATSKQAAEQLPESGGGNRRTRSTVQKMVQSIGQPHQQSSILIPPKAIGTSSTQENPKPLVVKSNDSTSQQTDHVRSELDALRQLVSQVLEVQQSQQEQLKQTQVKHEDAVAELGARVDANRPGASLPESVFNHYTNLIQHEVSEELADEICHAMQLELSEAELANGETVREHLVQHLMEHLPVAENVDIEGIRTAGNRPFTMALIGPTGVGKTTTIAKLAASFKLREGRSVGLITTDTYRIAAVDQLRTYANIIGVPLKVAMTPAEIASACHALRDVDVILIDTAGRSPNDTSRIEEIHSFIEAAQPHETHLVLSSASSENVLLQTIERFASVQADQVIFTKLDEAVNFGVIVNVMKQVNKRLSFVTTGQEVPDQIEHGEPRRLAQLILGESLKSR